MTHVQLCDHPFPMSYSSHALQTPFISPSGVHTCKYFPLQSCSWLSA